MNRKGLAALVLTTLLGSARAELPPDAPLEPLPADPEKRLYYGALYDPEKYRWCMSQTPERRQIVSWRNCEEFRDRFEKFDPSRRDEFGELYDPRKYHECVRRSTPANTACDRYVLRRQPQPEYWPYPEVQGIKWPEAPQPPTYRRGMSPKEYFDALCEREAGEFIYRTVEGVESVFVVRPRKPARSGEMNDRYVLEDPYGYTLLEGHYIRVAWLLVNSHGVTDPKRIWYSAVDYPLSVQERRLHGSELPYLRLTANDAPGKVLEPIVEHVANTQARYGYTWRGIRRPNDRERGIAGGELAVVDLKTGEILGLRRGFLFSARRGGVNWETFNACPADPKRAFAKDDTFTARFLRKVLVPK